MNASGGLSGRVPYVRPKLWQSCCQPVVNMVLVYAGLKMPRQSAGSHMSRSGIGATVGKWLEKLRKQFGNDEVYVIKVIPSAMLLEGKSPLVVLHD